MMDTRYIFKLGRVVDTVVTNMTFNEESPPFVKVVGHVHSVNSCVCLHLIFAAFLCFM